MIFGKDTRFSGVLEVDLGKWRWLTEKSRRREYGLSHFSRVGSYREINRENLIETGSLDFGVKLKR